MGHPGARNRRPASPGWDSPLDRGSPRHGPSGPCRAVDPRAAPWADLATGDLASLQRAVGAFSLQPDLWPAGGSVWNPVARTPRMSRMFPRRGPPTLAQVSKPRPQAAKRHWGRREEAATGGDIPGYCAPPDRDEVPHGARRSGSPRMPPLDRPGREQRHTGTLRPHGALSAQLRSTELVATYGHWGTIPKPARRRAGWGLGGHQGNQLGGAAAASAAGAPWSSGFYPLVRHRGSRRRGLVRRLRVQGPGFRQTTLP